MSHDNSAAAFPVMTMQPVADTSHRWIGLALSLADGGSAAHAAALFDDFALADALGNCAILLPVDQPAAFAGDLPARLPPSRTILHCAWTADHAHGDELCRLRQLGYRLLLGNPPDDAFMSDCCTALSFECRTGTPPSATTAARLRRLRGPHLAVGVDTYQRFHQCADAGFSWFSGDYPLHPGGQGIARANSPGQSRLLRLLGLIVGDAETRDIESVLKEDAQLSYQLLRLVNSAALSPGTRIASFNQAITLLGRRQLQRWLQLLLYAHSAQGGVSPLLPRAAFRARLMESLCELRGGDRDEQDRAFMAGMFSLLDVLFGRPLNELLEPLHLVDDVLAALLSRSGRLGPLMAVVALSKRAPTPALAAWLGEAGLAPRQLAGALVDACRWTLRIVAEH
jgi:EAL and modified HD-GYP domain-containing signal transduction protein